MFAPSASIFSLLLMATGATKLSRPANTANAMRASGIPVGDSAVIVLAFVEMTLGSTVFVIASPILFAAQGALYAVFLAWVSVALASGKPISSCGCIGEPDTPPYWGHLMVNGVGLVASVAAALTGGGDLPAGEAIGTVAWVGIVGTGAWLAWQLIGTGSQLKGLSSR